MKKTIAGISYDRETSEDSDVAFLKYVSNYDENTNSELARLVHGVLGFVVDDCGEEKAIGVLDTDLKNLREYLCTNWRKKFGSAYYDASFIHGNARIKVTAKFIEFDDGFGLELGFEEITYSLPELVNGILYECGSYDEAMSMHIFANEQEKNDYEQLGKKLEELEKKFEDKADYGDFLFVNRKEVIQFV